MAPRIVEPDGAILPGALSTAEDSGSTAPAVRYTASVNTPPVSPTGVLSRATETLSRYSPSAYDGGVYPTM